MILNKKLFAMLLLIIFTALVVIVLMIIRVLLIEAYCANKAQRMVGSSKKLVTITDADRKQASILRQEASGKISWSISEELKCERQEKRFFLF